MCGLTIRKITMIGADAWKYHERRGLNIGKLILDPENERG
jgi:hypothetical protein